MNNLDKIKTFLTSDNNFNNLKVSFCNSVWRNVIDYKKPYKVEINDNDVILFFNNKKIKLTDKIIGDFYTSNEYVYNKLIFNIFTLSGKFKGSITLAGNYKNKLTEQQ